MKIAIDASRANRQNRTGVEWYSYHVIQELKKTIPAEDRVVLYTNESLKDRLETCPENWQEKILNWPPKYLWTQIRMWWELIVNPPDALLITAHTIPFFFIPKKIKVYITVHDVGFKRFPELYKKIQYLYHDLSMRIIKKRADKIITISEFSKKEIVDLYKVPAEKIEVIYNGYESKNLKEKDFSEKYQKPFLLFVGRIEKKKNIVNIIKAYLLAKEDFPNLKLILAGAEGNQAEAAKKLITKNQAENDIILTGYISEDERQYLMKNAEIFVFPTLYEGFGIPILEAFDANVPVVTSDMNPHCEVAGEAALFANPKSPQEIAESLEKILSDDNLKNNLIQKAKERVKDFSWQKTAQSIYNVLK